MLTTAQKKYLLTIYLLGQNGDKVRITDVASFLGVAKASTVRMMDKLIEEGYEEYLIDKTENREALLDFALWRTDICRNVYTKADSISAALLQLIRNSQVYLS